MGSLAQATNSNTVALGRNAQATHSGSTALGAGAATTANNQVVLGAARTAVKVGDIAASTAAQVGPLNVVTVDANGTLGRGASASAAQVDLVRQSVAALAAVSDEQFSALTGRVGTLEGRVTTLFDLASTQQQETRRGLAAVASLAQPHFPSEAGKTSYASNVAYFRGEVGFSAGVTHRFDGDFALTAGLAYGGGKNTAVRAGIAGEF